MLLISIKIRLTYSSQSAKYSSGKIGMEVGWNWGGGHFGQ